MPAGKSLRLFFIDGTAGGLVTAEIPNWTGHLLTGPRSQLSELLKREEAGRTGVYLLIGEGMDEAAKVQLYVGEGDVVATHLTAHAKDETKGFWTRAVVLTSKDANLTKAHARYLESRFIILAKEAGRSTLTNGTAPPLIALPEADRSDMEYFISQALIALPVLGVASFRTAPAASFATVGGIGTFRLESKKHSLQAFAVEADGEFVVRRGSDARGSWASSHIGYRPLREQLEADGSIEPSGGKAAFTRDVPFSSPSAAAAVVLGQPTNGRVEWVEQASGLPYGDWQASSLSLS